MFRKRFFQKRLFTRNDRNEHDDYMTSKMPEIIFAGIGEVVKECHDKHIITSCIVPAFKQSPKPPEEKRMRDFDTICEEAEKEFNKKCPLPVTTPQAEEKENQEKIDTLETSQAELATNHVLLPKTIHRALPALVKKDTASKIIPQDDIYAYCKFTSSPRPVTEENKDHFARNLFMRSKSRHESLSDLTGSGASTSKASENRTRTKTISISDFVPITSKERNKRPEINNGRPAGQISRNSIGNRSRKISHKYSGMGTIWKAPGAATNGKPPTALQPSIRQTNMRIVAHGPGHKMGVANNLKGSSLMAAPGVWFNSN